MTKREALEILGLSENATLEEIKQAFKKLSRLHHPDNYMQAPESVRLEHEEEMKKINSAYAYFTKFNLDNYRSEIVNKINAYYENTTVVGDLALLMRVRALAEKYNDLVYFRDNKSGIDCVFTDFLSELKKKYESYKISFYQDNYVDEAEVKDTINYNLRVEDFYIQLCRIRDRYGKKIKFEKRLEQEIAPYKLYATCTNRLWNLISNICFHNAIIKAKESNFNNTEEAISNMHKEIKDLFRLVDEINEMFNAIGKELEEINDESLNQKYDEIKHKYDRGDSLDDIKRYLTSLKEKIAEYKIEQARLAKMKEDEPIVNGIYSKLLSNYSNVLMSLNPVIDNDRIKDITEFLQIVMNLFVRYSVGLIDLDRLLMLNEITFMDMIKDKELLDVIISGKNINVKRLKIYLKRKPFCNQLVDDQCFFVLREENGKYFMRKMSYIDSKEQEISVKILEREYISLDEVMKTAIYQGYTSLYLNTTKVQNLYELNVDGDYRYIILDDGIIDIINYGTLLGAFDACSDEYKNKEYFMDALQEQIQEYLDNSNSRK